MTHFDVEIHSFKLALHSIDKQQKWFDIIQVISCYNNKTLRQAKAKEYQKDSSKKNKKKMKLFQYPYHP
jgi:hypothetical protein